MKKNNGETMQKKSANAKKIVLAVCLAVVIALFSFMGGYCVSDASKSAKIKNVDEILSIIERYGYFVDERTGETIEFDEKDYADAITKGLLDAYCRYYTKEEYSQAVKEGQGFYNGVGLTLQEDTCEIFKVIGNSPADLAGIKSGETILAGVRADKTRVNFSTGKDIINFLDEQENAESVTLILDGGTEGEKAVTLKKGSYYVSYVTYYDNEQRYTFSAQDTPIEKASEYMSAILNDDTAYIRLDQFEGDAANQLDNALYHMQERGRTKLILDLRNNGGGYMSVLTDVASMLIKNQDKSKTLVAVSKGKNGSEEFYTSTNAFKDNVTAISVIANENSASASECLIGAMLHYGDFFSKDRLIIERNQLGIARTYGKGIMQTTFNLSDGGAFKVTTANVFWPDKTTCIHEKGIIATAENSVSKGDGAIVRAQATLN